MEITPANANAYFAPGNHDKADLWLRFDETRRAGAIATARRMFELELGRKMRETETDESRWRDDFAVYEQALWLLLGGPVGDGRGDVVSILQGAAPAGQNAGGGQSPRGRDRWSLDALRWLGNVGASCVRS